MAAKGFNAASCVRQDVETCFCQVRQLQELYRGYMGVIWGLYGENGKENGNYYFGFRVEGFPKDRFSVG